MNTLTDLLLALAKRHENLTQVLYHDADTNRPVRVSDLLRADAAELAS